ncbi:MAG: DinB family protein [Phycisphaerales bacterium]
MAKKNRAKAAKAKGKKQTGARAGVRAGRKAKPAGRAGTTKAAKASVGADAKEAAIEAMTFAHTMVVNVCNVPAESLTHQGHAHENHALWTLGHLAGAYDWFAGMLDGEPSRTPAHFQEPFGGKSAPVRDATKYPPLAEVKSVFDASWARLLRAAKGTSAGDLRKATRTDSMGFAPSRLVALHRVAWHDGWHAGQVSTIRRSLGLPSVM